MKLLITLEELENKKSRDLIPCECKGCKKTFYPTKNLVQRVLKGTKSINFCSKNCFYSFLQISNVLNFNCENCHQPFSRKKSELNNSQSGKRFCSKDCSISYFNNIRKLTVKENFCQTCHCKLKYRTEYCRPCYQIIHIEKREKKRNKYIERWIAGLEVGYSGKTYGISHNIRRYLLQKYDNKCSKCGWDKIHPITNKVPLEINHMDGNPANCKENNLEVICPNCHSLTPNFRALNKNSCRIRK